ncbi:MAG: cytochrome c oxidase cbb3-type subunit [Verrucomicrobiota bacterium]|jgi:cytochrome c oxidase cbb3-type subunit 2
MKGFTPLILGIFVTLAFSWMGLAFIPNLQIGHLEPQTDEEGKDPYPAPKSGMAERGRRVYASNGCFYCHSQQVRADYAGSDIERKWGERRSAPRDYIFERPVELGKMRMGPDLANIGHRAPAEDENAQAQASPAPGSGASPANASPAPAGSAATPGATGTPAAKPQVSPAAAPNAASSPAATAGSPAANQNAKAPAAASQSPATAATTPASAINSANPATTGASPAVQQAGPAVAGAVTTLDSFPSDSPPPYSAAWHHQHLYSPRSINVDSNMPAYKFLYIKRPVSGQVSARALKLRGEEAPREGWEIVPSYDADCLVAYLMSLDQSHPLKEVKSTAPLPSPSAPGKTAK